MYSVLSRKLRAHIMPSLFATFVREGGTETRLGFYPSIESAAAAAADLNAQFAEGAA